VWANHHVMFYHIRHADRLVLFLNTLLLMDIALLPFTAAVLASSFRDGQGERTAVVFHGISFEIAAALFNVIWWHVRHNHRLLTSTVAPVPSITGPDDINAAFMFLQPNAAQPHAPSEATRERGRRHQSRLYHQHGIPGQLMLIMKLGPPPGRSETGDPLR
jgi:hypothetical protein